MDSFLLSTEGAAISLLPARGRATADALKVLTFQSLMVLSCDVEASMSPHTEKVTVSTGAVCELSVVIAVRCPTSASDAFHSLTSQSLPEEASMLPLGENATSHVRPL